MLFFCRFDFLTVVAVLYSHPLCRHYYFIQNVYVIQNVFVTPSYTGNPSASLGVTEKTLGVTKGAAFKLTEETLRATVKCCFKHFLSVLLYLSF